MLLYVLLFFEVSVGGTDTRHKALSDTKIKKLKNSTQKNCFKRRNSAYHAHL